MIRRQRNQLFNVGRCIKPLNGLVLQRGSVNPVDASETFPILPYLVETLSFLFGAWKEKNDGHAATIRTNSASCF